MVIKMPSSDVAADMCSSDSLSLTGLVCIQDSKSQPAKSQEPHHKRKTTKLSENDMNFELSYSAQSQSQSQSQSTDLFNLQLSQQASQVHGNVTMKDVLEPRNRGRKPGNVARGTDNEVGKYESKENNNGGFAKLMQSIITPCRSCSAVEPSAVVKRTSMAQ